MLGQDRRRRLSEKGKSLFNDSTLPSSSLFASTLATRCVRCEILKTRAFNVRVSNKSFPTRKGGKEEMWRLMPKAGVLRRVSKKMCEDMDVVEMKHLHRFQKYPDSFNVIWQPPVHLALVDQFRYEERGPMCVSTREEELTKELVRALRFSRAYAMERHRGVCKTWSAFVSVAHITESSNDRRKSLKTTKMYRGKIIWKRSYESDLKTRHDEEIQEVYLKRKRTTKRSGRILFVRADHSSSGSPSTTPSLERKSSSARDALEHAIARSKERTSKIKHKIMVATPENFLKRLEPSRDESKAGLTFTFVRNTTSSRGQPKYVYVTCVFGDSNSRADMIAHAVRVMGKVF